MAGVRRPCIEEVLSEILWKREVPNGGRKLNKSICEGYFRF